MLARIRVHLELRDRNQELAEQNEKHDAAIQQRIATKRTLRDSLDRAVLVTDAPGSLQFVAAATEKLMRQFFSSFTGEALPRDVVGWLERRESGIFTANARERRLELTCAPVTDDQASPLVYLDEKAPPPSPDMLLVLVLPPREAEILLWVAQGKTSPEIAVIIGNAPATVKKHVENITTKLDVETRLAAALKAMEVMGLPG